jgi:hypothetical protein
MSPVAPTLPHPVRFKKSRRFMGCRAVPWAWSLVGIADLLLMVDCYRLVGGRLRAMVPSSTTRAGSADRFGGGRSPELFRPRARALRTRTPLLAAAWPMRAPEGSTQSPEPGHRCLPEVGGLGRCVRIVGERRSLVKNHVQLPRIHAPAGPRGARPRWCYMLEGKKLGSSSPVMPRARAESSARQQRHDPFSGRRRWSRRATSLLPRQRVQQPASRPAAFEG